MIKNSISGACLSSLIFDFSLTKHGVLGVCKNKQNTLTMRFRVILFISKKRNFLTCRKVEQTQAVRVWK